jgi:ABC-2 type transport system permease protein
MLFGVIMGATGMSFAVVTAVICQLSANPRTASAFSFLFLGISFMLRAMGDIQNSRILTGISPLGIITMTRVFADNFWWPIAIVLLTCILVALAAFWLCSTRDMGAGIIAAGPGRADAKSFLKSPEGLAWQLLKTPFIVWSCIFLGLGLSFGSLMGDLESIIESNEMWRAISEGDPLRLTTFFVLTLSTLCAIPVLQFILRARSQEALGYTENILARSVSRHEQLRGYFLVSAFSCFVMPFMSVVGLWSAGYAVMENPIAFSGFLSSCMVYTPALLAMLGVAVLLIGYLPRLTTFVWAYMAYGFGILYFGAMIGLPDWFAKLSPFGHIPNLPMEEYNVWATIILLLLATILSLFGFVGHRNRDMVFS